MKDSVENVHVDIGSLIKGYYRSVFCDFRLIFGIFFLLNLVLWAEGSSAAVPSTTLRDLLALWYVFSAL